MTIKQWWHRMGSPRWFYGISGPWVWVFGSLAALLLIVGTVWGLAFAPPDYQQGNSFRIMYVHVPTAIVAQSAYMLMGAAGLVLLVWRMKLADMVLACTVPFGMSMTARTSTHSQRGSSVAVSGCASVATMQTPTISSPMFE